MQWDASLGGVLEGAGVLFVLLASGLRKRLTRTPPPVEPSTEQP
jgi:hypothetical protein